MQAPVFVWGLGTQKAGTSWLARYLRRRPDVFIPFAKELHAFNYWWNPQAFQWVEWVFRKNIADFSDSDKPWLRWMAQELNERLQMKGPEDYPKFFIKRLRSHHRAYGEFTPSYILLPKSVLQQMQRLFPESKAIVLLRDPASRLLSAARMQSRRRHVPLAQQFEELLKSDIDLLYGRYEVTIPTVEEVFSRTKLLIMFMHEIFSDEGIGRICEFLGIPFIRGNYHEIEHGAPPDQEKPTREMWETAISLYCDTYRWAKERFRDRIPSSWQKIPD
ncbi:MAG: sulfotransferase [Acetobacteraceae bacterium]|nr:sulfotransferase [Acetobacteraceae bacterium]